MLLEQGCCHTWHQGHAVNHIVGDHVLAAKYEDCLVLGTLRLILAEVLVQL